MDQENPQPTPDVPKHLAPTKSPHRQISIGPALWEFLKQRAQELGTGVTPGIVARLILHNQLTGGDRVAHLEQRLSNLEERVGKMEFWAGGKIDEPG